jgi:hypothetical protein
MKHRTTRSLGWAIAAVASLLLASQAMASTLSVGDDPSKGESASGLVLIDFSDYQ